MRLEIGPAVLATAMTTPALICNLAAVIVPPMVPLAIENPRLALSPVTADRTLNRLSVKNGSTPVTRLKPTPKLIPTSIVVATFTVAAADNSTPMLVNSEAPSVSNFRSTERV